MPRHSKEYQAFTSTVDRLLTVSKEELDRRLMAYKAEADKNPNKRGPKRKVKASVSHVLDDETPSG